MFRSSLLAVVTVSLSACPLIRPPSQCEVAQGSCVAVVPGACANGHAGDPQLCGEGVGVMCCLPGASVDAGTTTDAGTTEACTSAGGTCVAVTPGSCASGRFGPANSCGGVGATCCLPAALDAGTDACASAGGTCVAVTPGSCASGRFGPANSCGGVGATCCLPAAPVDAGTDACTSAGGSCVPVTPGSCASGRYGPANSCGGVGATCCLPTTVDAGTDACTSAGGSCVPVTPGSCASGRIGPANSCGGVGATCCLGASDSGVQVGNPAVGYCAQLGYQSAPTSGPTGESSDCVFPTGERCDAFAFYRGECGASWTKCAKAGGTVVAEAFDAGTWTGTIARCTLPSGATCNEVDFARTGTCQ